MSSNTITIKRKSFWHAWPWIAIVGSHLPLVVVHLFQTMQRSEYQYIPFVFAAIAYFAYEALNLLDNDIPNPRWKTVIPLLLLTSFMILVVATYLGDGYIANFALFGSLASTLLFLRFDGLTRRFWSIWALLFLTIPLPFSRTCLLYTSDAADE